MEDLNRAVDIADTAVATTPPDHPDRAGRLSDLGNILGTRFQRMGTIDDLNRAIDMADMAVAATPSDHPDRASRLSALGIWLGTRFEWRGVMNDLNRAVDVTETAVAITPLGHPDRARYLNNLGNRLGTRFIRTGAIDDLNRAVDAIDTAVAAIPPDHPDRAGRLSNLGFWLGRRFERMGIMDDLNRAVAVTIMAVAAIPSNHQDRAKFLDNLGNRLGTRFERVGDIDDLNRAVAVTDIAVAATPPDHPDRAGRLDSLGMWLCRRFERLGAINDLNRAVDVANVAVTATPRDCVDRAGRLNNLGVYLGRRFERTGVMDDLNRAIDIADMAVAATPSGHQDRAKHLNNLGNRLGRRFERMGVMNDLDRAVDVADMAVATTPPNHPDRARHMNNLGIWLGRRFERKGAIDDLNRAVDVIDIAVAVTPPDHPDRTSRLNNLGVYLGTRFERIGAIDDLNRAVNVTDMAVAAISLDHPDRADCLNNLGIWLGKRFERNGIIDDLNRSVDVTNMAVVATPPDHPDRPRRWSNLGLRLGTRFKRIGALEDLNRAIDAADIAVAAIPPDHPDRATCLSNLGIWLGTRFERTGAINDLNRAVDVTNMAVAATPPDHPDRAGYLSNLGDRLLQTGLDVERSLSSFKEGWNCRAGRPSIRLNLARKAAALLMSQSDWKESSSLLREAVKLLPIVSPRSLENTDKQHILGEFSGLASMAAATALNAGREARHALELLELGRGVIAGLLLDLRTDISKLKEQHPKLAQNFEYLRDELDSSGRENGLLVPSNSAPSWRPQAKRRDEVDQELQDIIAEIRTKPGFQGFLLPPTSDELMAAAENGPIVVLNVNSYRCDAFLVEHHQIRVLQLPDLQLDDVTKKVQHPYFPSLSPAFYRSTTLVLRWLWDIAARPILEALGFTHPPADDNWPHVWWIVTGQLSHLPFHAAGYHFQGSTDTVLDRVISSYSTSIKALIHGRRHVPEKSAESASDHALLVAMRETPGNSVLPFAEKEVQILRDFCLSLGLKVAEPPRRRKDVLDQLPTSKIFHFAGHGKSDDRDPSQSCLLLEDWKETPLTVGDLRDTRFRERSPFLGYLSACSTGANKVEKLVDEGIHLVSACQLAGFRHVVGTLWEVSDEHCVDVARDFYQTIKGEGLTDVAVSRGLHQAVRTLRDRHFETQTAKGERRFIAGGAPANHGRTEEVVADDGQSKTVTLAIGKDTSSEAIVRMEKSEIGSNNKECEKAKGKENGPKAGENDDDKTGPERDAKLISMGSDGASHCTNVEHESPVFWACYFHFGV